MRATIRTYFTSRRGLEYPRVATEYDLQKIIMCVDVCIEFKLLKVKVPIIFLGTVGFSLRRDGR